MDGHKLTPWPGTTKPLFSLHPVRHFFLFLLLTLVLAPLALQGGQGSAMAAPAAAGQTAAMTWEEEKLHGEPRAAAHHAADAATLSACDPTQPCQACTLCQACQQAASANEMALPLHSPRKQLQPPHRAASYLSAQGAPDFRPPIL